MSSSLITVFANHPSRLGQSSQPLTAHLLQDLSRSQDRLVRYGLFKHLYKRILERTAIPRGTLS